MFFQWMHIYHFNIRNLSWCFCKYSETSINTRSRCFYSHSCSRFYMDVCFSLPTLRGQNWIFWSASFSPSLNLQAYNKNKCAVIISRLPLCLAFLCTFSGRIIHTWLPHLSPHEFRWSVTVVWIYCHELLFHFQWGF